MPVDWEQALELVAGELARVRREHGLKRYGADLQVRNGQPACAARRVAGMTRIS